MSDEAGTAPGVTGDLRNGGPGLYSATGERVLPRSPQVPNQTDQVADFVQQQPLATALIALIVGYLLGKIT